MIGKILFSKQKMLRWRLKITFHLLNIEYQTVGQPGQTHFKMIQNNKKHI